MTSKELIEKITETAMATKAIVSIDEAHIAKGCYARFELANKVAGSETYATGPFVTGRFEYIKDCDEILVPLYAAKHEGYRMLAAFNSFTRSLQPPCKLVIAVKDACDEIGLALLYL